MFGIGMIIQKKQIFYYKKGINSVILKKNGQHKQSHVDQSRKIKKIYFRKYFSRIGQFYF